MKKAITHLKFDRANARKRHKLDELSVEYLRVAQRYVDWLIDHEQREPNKYAPIPEKEIPTSLSDRWQRCMWMHACGAVQSWYSNGRTNRPVLHNICIQANTNVVKIEQPQKASSFDLWLRISAQAKARANAFAVVRETHGFSEFGLHAYVTQFSHSGSVTILTRSAFRPSPREATGRPTTIFWASVGGLASRVTTRWTRLKPRVTRRVSAGAPTTSSGPV